MQEMTIAQIRALSTVSIGDQFYVTDPGKEGHWYCSGTGTTDDTGMVLATASGYQVKRITDGFINLDWFDPAGNGITDDYIPISKALSYKMKLVIPRKKYRLNTALNVGDYFNIESHGAEFIFSNSVPIAIRVNGSASGSYSITQPLVRGVNYITSASLAAVAQKGDIVTIRNGEAFSPYAPYANIKKGETKEVLRIDGSNVYFTSPAHDSYGTDSFAAQRVTPCYVRIAGDFTLTIDQDNYNTSEVIGMQVYLANKPQITAKFNYCTEAALRINSCFQADVRVWVANSTENSNGYGVAIMNGTAESGISGIFADCRHAVACVADNSGVGGIPHHIKIYDVIASGARGNAMIDTHGTAGLVEFNNISCTGGTIKDVSGADVIPGGINIGCREAVIKGFTGDQLSSSIVIRSDANTQYLDVSNVTLLNSMRLISFVNVATVKKIIINGVRGDLTEVALLFGNAASKTDMISVSNVNFTACKGLLTIAASFLPPDEITLTNVKLRNVKDANGNYKSDDSSCLGIFINGASVKVLRLEHCLFEGFFSGVKFSSTGNVEQFISLGNVYKDNREHIVFDGNEAAGSGSPIVRCKEFKSVGDSISGHKHTGDLDQGVVNVQYLYNIIEYAQVDAFSCDDEEYFFGKNSTVQNICIGVGKGTGFVEMAKLLTGYEILSGTLTNPLIIRGNANPEGAVTAKLMALYMWKDTSTPSVYYKTTNSGNTGWVAL